MKKTLFFSGLIFANCCYSQVSTFTWTQGFTESPLWTVPENWTPPLLAPDGFFTYMGSCSTVYIFPSGLIENQIGLENLPGTVNYSLALLNNSATTIGLFNNGNQPLNFTICGISQGGYNAGIQGPIFFGGSLKPSVLITSPIASLSDKIYIPGGLTISGCESLSGSSLDVLAVSEYLTVKDCNGIIANLSLDACVSSVELNSTLVITQNSIVDPSYSPQFLNSIFTIRDSSQISVITAMTGYSFQGSTINAVGADSVFGYETTSLGSTSFVGNIFNIAKNSGVNISNQGSQTFSNNTFNLTDNGQLVFETVSAMGGQTNFNFTVSGNSSPVVRFQGNGNVSSTYCHGNCGSLVGNNLTYDLYLSNPTDLLNISVTTSAEISSGQNIQVMQFINGFGTISALIANSGCCYNSPGLGTDNNFSLGTVSLFDPLINQNSILSLIDNSDSPYVVFWSDISPQSFSKDYVGIGYVDQKSGQILGVNGVFGLYVDVHSKHHSLGSVGSFQQTSNNQNTSKKMGKQRLSFEQAEDLKFASLSDHEDSFMASNDDKSVYKNLFLAQQSEVQQLAERNFAKTNKPWSFYLEPRGSFGQVYAQKNHFGNTFQSAGTRVGFDYLWTNQTSTVPICAGLGFVADYVHTWGQRSHHSGKFQVNEGFGSLYSTIVPKSYRELSFNTVVGGGYAWYDFKRDVFEDSQVVATGNSGGPQYNVYFEMEYLFRHKIFPKIPKDFRIAPVVAMQYNYFKINSYNESGAGRYDLHVSSQSASTLSSLIGFRTNYEFMANSPVTVRPELILLWQHQYLDPSLVTTAYSSLGVGPDIITAALPGFPRNTLFAGADVKVSIYDSAEVQLNYDFIYNKGFVSNVFFLELKGKF